MNFDDFQRHGDAILKELRKRNLDCMEAIYLLGSVLSELFKALPDDERDKAMSAFTLTLVGATSPAIMEEAKKQMENRK